MRKFNVKVNGNTYQVEVEELEGSAASVAPAAAPAAPAPVKAPATTAASLASAAAAVKPAAVQGGEPVKAPMPGKVLKLSVANGATVKKGETILLLEAMKMENPINATADGVVNFAVAEGADVESGTVLATIK